MDENCSRIGSVAAHREEEGVDDDGSKTDDVPAAVAVVVRVVSVGMPP